MKNMSPEECIERLRAKDLAAPPEGLACRVVQVKRGRPLEQSFLNDLEVRRLAWVSDGAALKRFTEVDQTRYYREMGKRTDWHEEVAKGGLRIELVVFECDELVPATWDGLRDAAQRWFSDATALLAPHWRDLPDEVIPPAEVARLNEGAVKRDPTHRDHMTFERFAANPTLRNARVFLWHGFGANPDYAGGGYSKCTLTGRPTFAEHFVPNRAVRELRYAHLTLQE